MTAKELIAEIKAECEHNIRVLETTLTRVSTGRGDTYMKGYYTGLMTFDRDILEKITEWENHKIEGRKNE